MIKELGAEMAADLRDRHLAQDPAHTGKFVKKQLGLNSGMHVSDTYVLHELAHLRHPDFPDREDMLRYKNYASTRELDRKKFETSAGFELEADVDEDEMMEQMMLGMIISRM